MRTTEAKPHEHNGRALRCPLCGSDRFRRGVYALRTVEDEMFKQPWAADEMTAYACAGCGHVLWFA